MGLLRLRIPKFNHHRPPSLLYPPTFVPFELIYFCLSHLLPHNPNDDDDFNTIPIIGGIDDDNEGAADTPRNPLSGRATGEILDPFHVCHFLFNFDYTVRIQWFHFIKNFSINDHSSSSHYRPFFAQCAITGTFFYSTASSLNTRVKIDFNVPLWRRISSAFSPK